MSVYITGDTHGEFERIKDFCDSCGTTEEDILIILGDAGINFFLDQRDERLKAELAEYPITLFCIRGNHEEYPNLIFAEDGEIYDFDGKKAVVLGGAYSVDKYYRLRNGIPWFDTEQPDDNVKEYAERQLDKAGWKLDYVFSHTVPLSYEPRWAFLPSINQAMVDKTTEKWLEEIYNKLDFGQWFAGHYHVDSSDGNVNIMFEEIEEPY